MTKILGVIPARYASTRFPAKALADINGKSMVQRVYEQAKKAKQVAKVVVATDHEAIFNHVQSFGGEVVMTSTEHLSGTDRCMEAMNLCGGEYGYVINIQGDEPFIKPEQIDLLASLLDGVTELATLIIPTKEDLQNPNAVKVVMNKQMEAIYFSRHPLPYLRNYPLEEWPLHFNYYRHIGIYAYRTDVLAAITKLPPSPLELAESLEQLRWIENGYKIKVKVTEWESHGIDTPADLERVLKMYS